MDSLKYRRLVAEKEITNGIVDVKKKTLKNMCRCQLQFSVREISLFSVQVVIR